MAKSYVLIWFPSDKKKKPEVCRTLFTSKRLASQAGRGEADPGDTWAVYEVERIANVGGVPA